MVWGYAIRALTGNYKWIANSLNQNVRLDIMVCTVSGSSLQIPHAGEPGQVSLGQGVCHQHVAQQRVEVLALHLSTLYCPGCSISCMAIPGCEMALCGTFPHGCSGTIQSVQQSLAPPWVAQAHSGHSLRALCKAQNLGFL